MIEREKTPSDDYGIALRAIADKLDHWPGDIVISSHIDPDGDALGSALALRRALVAKGKLPVVPLEAPDYLSFLVKPNELSPPLSHLPNRCLLISLDTAEEKRISGVPFTEAESVINIDHHLSNTAYGDISLIRIDKAATAEIIVDLISVLEVPWTEELATPCLTGILTDTGNFRYSNTTPETLRYAATLIELGVDFARLTDRLQWRHPSYFTALSKVLSTVEFLFDGLVTMAHLSQDLRNELGEMADDSEDYVGLIRYAEGSKVAIFLKEGEGHTKISVRTRDGVSAQTICQQLGGGGHLAAAGAKVDGDLSHARQGVIEATRLELVHRGYAKPTDLG
ncbi:MAG: DHH family phosphoesterase [Trueperaceae bacterium]|nr:MAG: DHH family phosphoesterase [Trueperaceae bacterium]